MGILLLVAAAAMYPLGRTLARRVVAPATSRRQQLALAAAGPACCWLAAITPMIFVTTSDVTVPTLTVEHVEPGFPAALAGIAPGDVIEKIDGAPLSDFDALRAAVAQNRALHLELLRAGQPVQLDLTPRATPDGAPALGIRPRMSTITPSAIDALVAAHVLPLRGLSMAFRGAQRPMTVGGPVTLYVLPAKRSASDVIAPLAISFAGYCFLVAAVMLLPLPGLDGAALVLLALGRQLDTAWQARARKISLGVLGVLLGLLALAVVGADLRA